MKHKFDNILGTVGNTPIVRINHLAPAGINLYVKIEAFNPLGSVKDRLALGIIEDAEEYEDYHTIQGLPTAFTIARYHNGDMNSQTFYTKVEYDVDLLPATFNPDILLKKKQ